MSAPRLVRLVLLLATMMFCSAGLASARPLDKFHVRNFPDIVQGMSLAQLKKLVGNLNYNCPQRLGQSADDPLIYEIYLCDEPQIYLSFCNDQLYWAVTYRKGGFRQFVREIKTYKHNKAFAAYLEAGDVTVQTRAPAEGGGVIEDQLSVLLQNHEYTLTMTLYGAPTGEVGVVSEIRMTYQAKVDPSSCQ